MDAVSSALMLALSASIFGWTYVQYRRPNPSRWTNWSMSADLITISCIALLTFGLGHFGRVLAGAGTESFDLFELSAIIAITIAAVGIQFMLRRRFAALWAAAGRAAITALEFSDQPTPPLSHSSGRPRKAA